MLHGGYGMPRRPWLATIGKEGGSPTWESAGVGRSYRDSTYRSDVSGATHTLSLPRADG
jgi:hypothetical protein